MALKVLVTQTGGKILGPDNDLVDRSTAASRTRTRSTGYRSILRQQSMRMSITI